MPFKLIPMKRRDFIKTTGISLTVPMICNGLKLSAIPNSPLLGKINTSNDRILVIVQLLGGNDGLHTVIPRDQYANLWNARQNIILPETSILPVTSLVGFHPVMTGIKNIYDNGNLGIIQNVAYPNQNRSHFRSVDIWNTGSPADEIWNTGWAGRYLDTIYPGFPDNYPNSSTPHPIAIAMGSAVSETCQGSVANFSIALTDPLNFSQLYEGTSTSVPATNYGHELSFLRESIQQNNAYAGEVTNAANSGTNMVAYPSTNIAEQLRNVALLISGGMQTKIYVVTQDNFDTHANQVNSGDTTTGTHADLLKNVSDAMLAFQNDLNQQGLDGRVVSVTLSEFGRQIASNGSWGTDHGTAAPLFIFGSCVKPQILGNNPQIPTSVQDQEGVAMEYDFRDVYGSILQDWFGVDENDVRNLMYSGYTYLDIIDDGCKLSTTTNEKKQLTDIQLFPNPTQNISYLEMSTSNAKIKISVYNSLGAEIKIIMDKSLEEGNHKIPIDLSTLPSGNYYIRVQQNNHFITKPLVKID